MNKKYQPLVISILIKIHFIKTSTSIDKVDMKRTVLSKKDSNGKKKGSFKYFIGYISNHTKPLCIKRPQMNAYVKHFDSNNKYMNFLVCDEELLKNME